MSDAHGYVGLNPLGGGVANVRSWCPPSSATMAKGNADAFYRASSKPFPASTGG